MLKALPDTEAAQTRPAFLYTPYGGIKKFDSPESLDEEIAQILESPAERDELFRLLSITQRAELNSTSRSEEHTSELQSLMRISYAVFCLKKKTQRTSQINT